MSEEGAEPVAEDNPKKMADNSENLLYGVEENPPMYQCILLAFQNFLVFVGGTITTPLIIVQYMCMDPSDPGRGAIVATIIFVSGIITIMQTTFGVRIPIIQGSNFAYVAPIISLLVTTYPTCDSLDLDNLTPEERTEFWQVRMRDIQGAVTVSSLLQVFMGFTGLEGLLLTIVTPLTIVATIAMLAFSLTSVSVKQASTHWPISMMHLLILVLISQYFKKVKTPIPLYTKMRKCHIRWFPMFTYFPLLLATLFSWCICGVLTATSVFAEGSPARTDRSGTLVAESPWFRVPYPGQWGLITVSVSSVVGLFACVIASIIESIGDYNVCAETCHVVTPPVHAVCRGSGVEGIGGVLAGIFGTLSGTASYTTNITVIGITKVASRRVVQVSGVIMLIVGMFGKLCGIFATIPEPVLGANLLFMASLVAGLSFSPLRLINLSSTRNLFVLGFSLFIGIALPDWVQRNPKAIQTGAPSVDDTVRLLLQTTMFVGGFIALVLDNTIPGTAEERGLTNWIYFEQSKKDYSSNDPTSKVYDLPFGMNAIKRLV